jgi:peptide deformylase
VDERIRQLVKDMLETMYDAQGIGLAATQVDVHERVVVIDVSEGATSPGADQPRAALGQRREAAGRGRLPVRARHLRRRGALHCRQGQGAGRERQRADRGRRLLAICIQHEMDHLLGKVFVEYLSPLKRNRIKTKLLKQQKQAERA